MSALPKVADIVRAAAAEYGVTVDELRAPSPRGGNHAAAGTRAHAVIEARMVATYVARRLTKASWQQIGNHLGARNACTSVTRAGACARRMASDAEVKTCVDQVIAVAISGAKVIREPGLAARLASAPNPASEATR